MWFQVFLFNTENLQEFLQDMNSNEKKLHKNTACSFESILEAAPYKQLYGNLPPILTNHPSKTTRHVGHCWRS